MNAQPTNPQTRKKLVSLKRILPLDMDVGEKLTPKAIYEMVAELDFRKYFHFGGFMATQELIRFLPLDATKRVLEVGCASGKTACYLAKTYGCKVVGIDLLPGMVERARERARREDVGNLVEFQVGDAQALPSGNDVFDIVIGEFVTGLLPDKPKALGEYHRVAKPGGVIGLNEATWIKAPPPPGLTDYLHNVVGLQGEILSPEGWLALMEASGIQEITVETHQVKTIKNPKDDLSDVLRALPKLLIMYMRRPLFRKFIKLSLSIPENLFVYFGYGLYVGRS